MLRTLRTQAPFHSCLRSIRSLLSSIRKSNHVGSGGLCRYVLTCGLYSLMLNHSFLPRSNELLRTCHPIISPIDVPLTPRVVTFQSVVYVHCICTEYIPLCHVLHRTARWDYRHASSGTSLPLKPLWTSQKASPMPSLCLGR